MSFAPPLAAVGLLALVPYPPEAPAPGAGAATEAPRPAFDALATLESERAAATQEARAAAGGPAETALAAAARCASCGLLDLAQGLLSTSTDACSREGRDGLAVRADLLLASGDFEAAARLDPQLAARARLSEAAALAHVRLLLLEEDHATLDRWARARPAKDPVRLLAEAHLARVRNDHARAEQSYAAAEAAPDPAGLVAAEARLGRAACALRADHVDDARKLAAQALDPASGGRLSSRGLDQWAGILIRASETSAAIDVLVRVVDLWPSDELAHYQLGNGYSRWNYTELAARSPAAFPRDAAFTAALVEARRTAARDALAALAASHPAACEPPAVLASLAWSAGDLEEAERQARESLRREPGYGRAHAVLARVLESRRRHLSVQAARDEERFAAEPRPDVPGIDRFVTNWTSLTPRQQKRVALSVAPWGRFVPVLLEGGQTFTLKLLHEKLSETPDHESLADLRIDYDSRLWDDVRGCGGTDTVTGVEDVEATIFRGYDTVLHELSHQVHSVLGEPEQARIQALYAAARRREAGGKEAFLSRYQASSEWEYFAEGVHAACTQPDGKWDPREMRADRLQRIDPDLASFVHGLLHETDTSRFRAPALVGRCGRALDHGQLADARAALDAAAKLAPADPRVLSNSLSVRLYAGETARAEEDAKDALGLCPTSADVALAAADVSFHAHADRDAARALLSAALPRVDAARKPDLDLAVGWFALEQAQLGDAHAQADAVLAVRPDDPDGLELLVAVLGLDCHPGTAVNASRLHDAVTRLVRRRTGSRSVRAGAAVALARAGDIPGAREQVEAGLLNAPDSDEVLAAKAYVEYVAGDLTAAGRAAQQAADLSPEGDATWNDLAALVGVLSGDACPRCQAAINAWRSAPDAPPRYVRVEREHAWRSVHRHGPLERELFAKLPAGASGRS